MMFSIFLAVEGVMSFITLIVYIVDKSKAKRGARRIPEKTLHLFTWLFGAPGALVGIAVIRHKSKHPQFWISAILALLVQGAAGVCCLLFL